MCSARRHTEVNIINPLRGELVDRVSIEEPLEIWLSYIDTAPDNDFNSDLNSDLDDKLRRVEFSLSITMRTPGDDAALVTGFLFAEGIIKRFSDITKIEPFGPITEPLGIQNQIKVYLNSGHQLAEKNLQRYFLTNSSCGVCGKASIAALQMLHQPDFSHHRFSISQSQLTKLPAQLRSKQQEFDHTGGLHAVALVDSFGQITLSYEDIGRHNAMDKLIGRLVMDDTQDGGLQRNRNTMVLVSGRASYELVQKALMAELCFFAAIGAPSSAAVELAASFDMTLVGFLRADNYNVYHQANRIRPAAAHNNNKTST